MLLTPHQIAKLFVAANSLDNVDIDNPDYIVLIEEKLIRCEPDLTHPTQVRMTASGIDLLARLGGSSRATASALPRQGASE